MAIKFAIPLQSIEDDWCELHDDCSCKSGDPYKTHEQLDAELEAYMRGPSSYIPKYSKWDIWDISQMYKQGYLSYSQAQYAIMNTPPATDGEDYVLISGVDYMDHVMNDLSTKTSWYYHIDSDTWARHPAADSVHNRLMVDKSHFIINDARNGYFMGELDSENWTLPDLSFLDDPNDDLTDYIKSDYI